MANWVTELEERVVAAGGQFVRFTGKSHKLYHLGTRQVVIPGLSHVGVNGKARKNLEHQIARTLKLHAAETPPTAPRPPAVPEVITPPVVGATDGPVRVAGGVAVVMTAKHFDPLQCPECGVRRTTASALGSHRRKVHGVLGTSKPALLRRKVNPTALVAPAPAPQSANVIAEQVQALVRERDALRVRTAELEAENRRVVAQLKLIQDALKGVQG
jgi:hypothetical protein